MRFNQASPEASPPTDQPALPPVPGKKSRKRIFVALGIVGVAAVALALVFMFLTSPSAGTTIALSYNFTPGEEMTYNLTANATDALGANTSIAETMVMDVIGFDGENYTISQRVTVSMSVGSPVSFNFSQKMNKTGYVSDVGGTSEFLQAYSMFSPVGSFWQKEMARVGETWEVPMNLGSSNFTKVYGNLTMTFGDVRNITVAAGGYRVFRIDVSGINISMVITVPPPANMSITENFTVSGHMYLEYGTCRLVQSDFQDSISIVQALVTSTQNISMHTELVKHTGY